MNKLINELVNQRLTKIFADYPQTDDLNDLKEEIASDLISSAEDKLTPETNEHQAVDQAFSDFGDIDEVINQVLNEDQTETDNHYQHTFQSHKLDIDEDGIRLDGGKGLTINNEGISINNGKAVKIDANGVKLGNMVINENGINFKGQTKAEQNDSFSEFNDRFNSANYETEVQVESLPLTDEKKFDLNDIQKIDVNYVDASLKLLPTDGQQVIVREYMSRNNPNYQLKTSIVDDTLTVTQGQIPHFLPLRVKVQILIPNDFHDQLRITNRSGNLQAANLKNLDEVLINVRSGVIYLNDLKLNKLLVSSRSGKVTLDTIQTKKVLAVESRDSVLSLSDVSSPDYNMESRSGTIKATDLQGAGKISAKSGTIKIDFEKVTGDVEVENDSGTVKLNMPTDDSYNFDLEAKSGVVKMNQAAKYVHDILSLKEGVVGSDPNYKLTVRAKSGIIKIN
jgi:hypothetical protein